MEWANIIIAGAGFVLTTVGVIVTLSITWGKFDTRLALMDQRLGVIEGNHLKTLQDNVVKLTTEFKLMRESQIRMEEKLYQLVSK